MPRSVGLSGHPPVPIGARLWPSLWLVTMQPSTRLRAALGSDAQRPATIQRVARAGLRPSIGCRTHCLSHPHGGGRWPRRIVKPSQAFSPKHSGSLPPSTPPSLWTSETRLAARRTPLLLRGSSVTERLRVAGNADWQEKRVPRCWPSVNGGTSGLEYGAGKPPPLNCQVLHLGSRSGPPQRHLGSAFNGTSGVGRGATVTGEGRSSSPAAPEALAGGVCGQPERGYNKAGAVGVPMVHLNQSPSGSRRVHVRSSSGA
jgi:hypothetical protein